MNARIDVRDLLPQIRGADAGAGARPRPRDLGRSRTLCRGEIPGATYLELPGEDHLPFVGDATSLLTAIARMLGIDADLSIDVRAVPLLPGEFPDSRAAAVLSARERDVLRWVARGKTNAEIATALYVSESTVRKHLQNPTGSSASRAALQPSRC